MNYMVGCPGRCGSMLTANIIWHAYYAEDQPIYYSKDDDVDYNGSAPVIHTHSATLFCNSNVNYSRVVITRPIIDSVLSSLISKKTNIYHFRVANRQIDYSSKIEVAPQDFANLATFTDRFYQTIAAANLSYCLIRYDDIKDNALKILDYVKDNRPINWNTLTENKLPRKMPVASQDRITNINQILDLYHSLNLKYKNGFK